MRKTFISRLSSFSLFSVLVAMVALAGSFKAAAATTDLGELELGKTYTYEYPCAEKYATSVFVSAVFCIGALPEAPFAVQEANVISVAGIRTAVIMEFNLVFIFLGIILITGAKLAGIRQTHLPLLR